MVNSIDIAENPAYKKKKHLKKTQTYGNGQMGVRITAKLLQFQFCMYKEDLPHELQVIRRMKK